jgi:uncharacterized membrane protein
MNTWIHPEDVWAIWAVMIAGVALCIYLEQSFQWAARASGPVLALVGAMFLSNLAIMPHDASAYDVVYDYLVPLAIPLLLFEANARRIFRETGPMFRAFHISAFGTVVGAFIAALLFRNSFERVPEITGIMTGSYTGGGVNFVSLKNSFGIESELANPLLVADNFIMAALFAVLLLMSGSRFFLERYAHPHSAAADREESQVLAARHWRRKEIALLDIAKALAIAFVITAVSAKLAGAVKAMTDARFVVATFGNLFIWITLLTVGIATLFHRRIERVHGANELGGYLLYLFFFVIGLRADLVAVVQNVPMLFLFCLVMALTNLTVTLVVGRLFRINLEELLLSVNVTLGGPPSAAAMAISKGWGNLVLPGLLAGIWGYVIGTFLGILVAEILMTIL